MRQTPVKRGNQEIHRTNPFTAQAIVRRNVKEKSKFAPEEKVMVMGKGGELLGERQMAGFITRRRVDATQFVKLYVDSVGAMGGLKTAGRKVFTALYSEIRQNASKDLVHMSFTSLDQLLFPMSRATYERGLQELKACGFIANSPTINMYWLNPTYMWNGDILAFLDIAELDGEANRQDTINGGQQALPIEMPDDDSFFNEKTRAILRQRMDDMDAGRGVQHSLIEAD
jgi:hypothetical protein